MPRNIFISYSTTDLLKVERIKRDLQKAGHHIWIYPQAIQIGDHIVTSEKEGIEKCDFVLFMWSKAAEKRKAVLEEIELVKQQETKSNKKILLIIRIDKDLPNFNAEGIQFCDLSDDITYGFNLHMLLKKIESHKNYSIKQTCRPDNSEPGYFEVKLSLQGDLSKVKEVDYHLHMDVATNKYTEDKSDNRASGFSIKFYSPDSELVYAVVRLKDETTEEIRFITQIG